MTSRGEILDSEDEGSDFSPPKLKVEDDFVQLIDADADMTASHLQPTSQAVRSTDSVEFDSTNPSDLENMHQAYEEHAAAAQGEKDAASQPARSLKSTAKSASSTDVSVVERVRNEQLSAALAKKRAKPEKKPEENADVWDVPSSPLRRPTSSSKRATKTYGKRRRTGQQSSPPQHGNTNDIPPTQNPHSTVYDLTESSPVAPVKRQKTRATRSSASMEKDSDTPVAIPIFQAPSDSNQRSSRSGHGKKESSSYNFDSSLPEMPSASIYIAPSALTASQKREYKTISLSSFQSELGHGSPASPLPNLNFDVGEGMQHRSSGATVSTIANTPGRYAPSRLTAVLSDDLTHDEPGSSTGPPGQVSMDYQPLSSPDIISVVTSAINQKQSQTPASGAGLPFTRADSHVATGSLARKRGSVQDSADPGELSWNADTGFLGAEESNNNPSAADALDKTSADDLFEIGDDTALALENLATVQGVCTKAEPPLNAIGSSFESSSLNISLPHAFAPPKPNPEPNPGDENETTDFLEPVQPIPLKNKRGRKKKNVVSSASKDDSLLRSVGDTNESGGKDAVSSSGKDSLPCGSIGDSSLLRLVGESPLAHMSIVASEPPKRKRGRPRKADVTRISPAPLPELEPEPQPEPPLQLPVEHEDTNEDLALSEISRNSQSTKKSRPKRKALILDSEDEGMGSDDEAAAKFSAEDNFSDDDIKENRHHQKKQKIKKPAPAPAAKDEKTSSFSSDVKVEANAKEVRPAVATPTKQQKTALSQVSNEASAAKVPLRVGLSKRSRIAPLLKIVRK